MICVSTALCYHFNRLIHLKTSFHKQTDKFRNNHCRMGIINLNHYIIRKVMQVTASGHAFIKNQLCTGRNHKVLLINSKNTTCLITVIRIKEKSKILFNIFLIKINSILYNTFIHALYIKQMQFIWCIIISNNINIIHSWFYCHPFKLNVICHIRFGKPAFLCKPWIRHCCLHIIFKNLSEQSKMIIQSNTISI